jgi:autotransporter-associated beta strand protein
MESRNLLLAAILGSACLPLHGANVTLDASDGFNLSSFSTDLNWDNNAAPTAGNDYFTGNFTLRTPIDANDHTFAGDSLTVNNTGPYPQGLFYKGTGTSATTGILTVNNLILNGGIISHGQGDGNFFNLAGSMAVTAPSTIWAKQGPTHIYSSISGSSNITVPAPDADIPSRTLNFHSSTSTYTGNLINNGRFVLADDAVFNFVIGAAGVNNSISGTGSTTTFNGDFVFDFTGASANRGDTWSIVTAAGQTYGSTFTVAGFTDNFDDTWSKDIGGGLSYLFRESSGTLSVVGPPENIVWLGGGADADAWDVNTTLNWQNEVPVAAKYFEGDNVSFTDAGLANPAVDVTVAVAPGSVTVDSTGDYSFLGAGRITGSTGLTKGNTGQLTLGTANDYSGGTSITGGALSLTGTGTLGSGGIDIASGGTLNFGNPQTISVAVTGAGNINHNGGGQALVTGDFSGFTGTYTHNSTVFSSVFNTSSATSAAAAYVIASTQGSFQGFIAAADGDYTLQMGSLSGVPNSLVRGGNFATGTTTLEIGALGTDSTFSGIIANGATKAIALRKVGTGTLTLEGANNYTGDTTVDAGILVITQDDVLNDASTLTLASASSLDLTHSGIDRVGALVIAGNPQPDGLYTFGTGKIQVGDVASPFETWATDKGLTGAPGFESGPADDPDQDGVSNLAEFAFNGNPLSGSDNGIVKSFITDSSDPGTEPELVLTIAVRQGTPAFGGSPAAGATHDGILYSVEGSLNLADFDSAVGVVDPITTGLPDPTGSGYEYRSFRLDASDGLSTRGFIRAGVAPAP